MKINVSIFKILLCHFNSFSFLDRHIYCPDKEQDFAWNEPTKLNPMQASVMFNKSAYIVDMHTQQGETTF